MKKKKKKKSFTTILLSSKFTCKAANVYASDGDGHGRIISWERQQLDHSATASRKQKIAKETIESGGGSIQAAVWNNNAIAYSAAVPIVKAVK